MMIVSSAYIDKCILSILLMLCCFIVITISFNQMLYRVNESDGTVEIMVGLSNPSMTDITVQLVSNGITAMSKSTYTSQYHHTLLNHTMYTHYTL